MFAVPGTKKETETNKNSLYRIGVKVFGERDQCKVPLGSVHILSVYLSVSVST